MHIIRLRRPWSKSLGKNAVPVRIDVPEADTENVLYEDQPSYYRRSFNVPSGLRASSRVYLRVDGWQGRLASAIFNGSPLDIGDSEINTLITHLLEPRNQITLCLVGLSGRAARLSGEVTLAIEDPDA